MKAAASAVLAAALLAPADASQLQTKAQERPIMKIVRLLQDMQTELQQELEDDKQVHEKLSCWCETNNKEKTKVIELAEAKIDQLKAAIGEAAAKWEELKEKRAATLAEINSDHKALTEASALRMKENKSFQASETDLLEAVAACKQAVVALSKHHLDLAQVKTAAEKLQSAKVSQLVVSTGALRRDQLNILKGFLEKTASAGTSSFLAVPGFTAYAPQSGQIYGILKQMKTDFESNLSEAQKAEAKAQSDYEELKAAKEQEIDSGKKAMAQLDADIGEVAEKHAGALQELDDTKAQLGLDQEFLANLEEKCANSAAEFDKRVKDRMAEIVAVEDTINILNSDAAFTNFGKTVSDPDSSTFVAGTAFLQIQESSAEKVVRASAVARLQKAAEAAKDPKLAMLAMTAKLDAFTKVKAEIDKLVAVYQQQQKDEVDHRDYCTAELNKNSRDTEKGNDKSSSLQTKIADLGKEIEQLTADIKATMDENVETQEQMKRASETREGENAGFQQTVADQRLTQQILKKAIERMMQVYETDKLNTQKLTETALVQEPGGPHIATSGTKTDPGNAPVRFADNAEQHAGGSRVIALLNEVLADSQKTENEAIASEEDSQSAYENFMKDSNKSIQLNLEGIANMQESKAKAEESLSMAKTDLKQTVEELSDLNDMAGDLHKSCDFILNNFDARQAARSAEIDALKEAKAILSGMK